MKKESFQVNLQSSEEQRLKNKTKIKFEVGFRNSKHNDLPMSESSVEDDVYMITCTLLQMKDESLDQCAKNELRTNCSGINTEDDEKFLTCKFCKLTWTINSVVETIVSIPHPPFISVLPT